MILKESFVIMFTALIVGANCRKYIEEKPDFLTPCTSTSPTFNECYRKNLQSVISEWKHGIPGIPSAGRFEPVTIKRLLMEQSDLKIEMKNLTIVGLGSTQLSKLVHNVKDRTIRIKAHIPKIRLEGDYSTSGRILFLPLNGHGRSTIEVENSDYLFLFKMVLRKDDSLTFADVESVKTKIKNIGGFHVNLTNLFNGNKQLEAHTSEIFNTNWREFLEVLRPTLEDSINAVVQNHFRKFLGAVPAHYFIADIDSLTI